MSKPHQSPLLHPSQRSNPVACVEAKQEKEARRARLTAWRYPPECEPQYDDPFCTNEIRQSAIRQQLEDFESDSDTREVILTRYEPANWWTSYGAKKKLKEIEKKGIPNLTDSRFITLTFDRERYPDPDRAFEIGREHIRKFMMLLRKYLGVTEDECPHATKLEVHEDGWPHFHIPFLYRKKFSYETMRFIHEAWGKGRTNVRRIKGATLEYALKYVTKFVDLPEWILNRVRIRVWQPSPHFYTNCAPISRRPPAGKHKTRKEEKSPTIGERIVNWGRSISVRYTDGKHSRRYRVYSNTGFTDLLVRESVEMLSGNEHVKIRSAHELVTTQERLNQCLTNQSLQMN
ncbi:hypothetical protein [Ruficoccus sp. ZRK36]|uniref:rolling circle replication-associated protein n=1 Tax=Ruficoccus sp. ZRK36 TaxID=2866311 RepID=UPI001C730F4C|nr:hypothetical protein [Ruficoccus sp. ZRK36]QYY35168.1 hypothetical protein K0V07_12785 [Ruficoccus sp. ZRK36]